MIYPSRAVDPGDHPHYATLLHSAQVHRIYLEAWIKSPQTFSQRLIHLLLADPQTDRDLKQTRFYQEVFAEGKQEGR